MIFQNLHFFTKNGDSANLKWNSDTQIFEGRIYLPKTSVNLFSNEHLFILEEFYNSSTSQYELGCPQNTSTSNYIFKSFFENSNVKQFSLYNSLDDHVQFITKIEHDLDLINTTTSYNGFYKIISNSADKSNTALKLNILFTSDLEDIYENILIITAVENNTVIEIAKIIFYSESLGEDERLHINMSNLGYEVPLNDFNLYRNTDIKEPFPDWNIINKKRKELLLEGHNIIPFTGSYKGLINAIKYYGYSELTLKEYWLNIDTKSPAFGKYKHTPVINIFDQNVQLNPVQSDLLPNKIWKKTSKFGLYYKINEVIEGKFTIDNLPVVEELLEFSNEEILIKLNGLKTKLKNKYLPTNARIVDITGEGDYFTKFDINTIPSSVRKDNVILGMTPSFTIEPSTEIYIQDLRSLTFEGCPLPTDLTIGDTVTTIADIADCYLGYFKKWEFLGNPGARGSFYLNDAENITVGAPIVLTNTSFKLIWNDAVILWTYLVEGISQLYTWDTIANYTYYQIEWIITKNTTVESPQTWSYSEVGNIVDLNQLALVLPYIGTYNVQLNLWDLFNTRSTQIENRFIEVLSKEPEIVGIFKSRKYEYDWTSDLIWKYYTSSWEIPFEPNIELENANVNWETLNRANYILNGGDPQIDIVQFYWDRIENEWNDAYGIWWDSCQSAESNYYSSMLWNELNLSITYNNALSYITWNFISYQNETVSNFILLEVPDAGILTIGSSTYTFSTTTSNIDFLNASIELNNSTDDIISKFLYNPVFDADVNDYVFVQAVAKQFGELTDYNVTYSNGAVGTPLQNHVTTNLNWNETSVIINESKIAPLTQVVFSYDNCRIPSKQNAKWQIEFYDANEIVEFNGKYCTYFFNRKGSYHITLELQDNNGNTISRKKNEWIKVV